MNNLIDALSKQLENLSPSAPKIEGRVQKFDGLLIEATGFPASPGTLAKVSLQNDTTSHLQANSPKAEAEAEVIGFSADKTLLFCNHPAAAIEAGAKIRTKPGGRHINVGPELLGRVIDPNGTPLDGKPNPSLPDIVPITGQQLNPLARTPVNQPLDVGVKIVNAALTIGRGQRIGIIAGSGVGKSVLIEMMARFTKADVVVVGLIGERAREVGDFCHKLMRGDAAQKICMIAVPADRSPMLRIRAAHRTTAIAEYFRDQGKQVLLIMDSLTRVAHAQREVGLALGEQPTVKGYPPSALSIIPALIERAGTGLPGTGAITALYTVLADGDDTTSDPVVDSARAILDGHYVLSRKQAQAGIYPAIDLEHSISRVMNDIIPVQQKEAVHKLRRMISLYMENRDLILMGGYNKGQDPELDAAIANWPAITALIQQNATEPSDLNDSLSALFQTTNSNLETNLNSNTGQEPSP